MSCYYWGYAGAKGTLVLAGCLDLFRHGAAASDGRMIQSGNLSFTTACRKVGLDRESGSQGPVGPK